MNNLGRYRKLYTRLWRHPGFGRLTDSEKVLAFYILTGPQANRLGLYVFSTAVAAEDLGSVPQTISKRLANVSGTFNWQHDASSRVIYIPSWWKWNPPENANVLKGNLKDLNEIPPCGLVDAFARNVGDLPQTLHETFLEGLRQRLPKCSRIQEQKQDHDQKQKPAALRVEAETGDRDARRLAIATRVHRDAPPRAPMDYKVDHYMTVCQNEGLQEETRSSAIDALVKAQ